MTDHPGFLAAILAAPDDDTPRLVYADWLEENGQPERAEFCRVQCELARDYDPHEWGPRADDLRRRERELLTENYGLRWAMPLLDAMGWSRPAALVGSWLWRRGFVEQITCSAADWLAHGPAVVACQPVREVRLSDWQPVYFGEAAWFYLPAFLLSLPAAPEAFHRLAGVRHDSQAGALTALSAACLAWARGVITAPTPPPIQSPEH